jgi:starch-binding outer membrane protein, SusD/RagB family
MKKLFNTISTGALLLIVASACESMLDVELPTNEILKENAFNTEADLQALLNSGYDVVANYNNGLSQTLSELLGDEIDENFADNNGFFKEVYNRNTNFFNSEVGGRDGYFRQPYIAIYRANNLLENVSSIPMPEATKIRMEAEAKFIRAISHFDLVKLFGYPAGTGNDDDFLGIALKRSTAIEAVDRSTVKEAYDFIIEDLEFANANLPDENGFYATKWAAKALLAKVYFQMNDFSNARAYATEVIGNTRFRLANNPNSRFLSLDSNLPTEGIFMTISTNVNDNRASKFTGNFRSDVNEPFLKITQQLYDFATVNPLDERAIWFKEIIREDGSAYYVINKYNTSAINICVIHLAEMHLIRAESLGELNQDLATAIADVNKIRNRSGLVSISPASSAAQIIEYAQNERRIELAIEGDRVHQLKRRGAKGESIQVRGVEWNCPGMQLQFPSVEGFPGFIFNEQGQCN